MSEISNNKPPHPASAKAQTLKPAHPSPRWGEVRWGGALLVLIAFGFGLFFGGYRDVHYAPAIACLLSFTLMAILPPLRERLMVPSAPVAILAFIFWIHVTLSISWSTVPFASIVTYLVFLALPLSFFAPLLSGQPQQWLQPLFIALMGAITLCALWAIIQFTVFHGDYGSRAAHPLPNPNNMAGLINLGLLPALALFIGTKDRNYKYAGYLALCCVLFAGLVATESRGGFIAMMLGLGILFVTLRHHPPKLWQRGVVVLLMGSIIFGMVTHFGGGRFAPHLLQVATLGVDPSSLARVAIWENAWPLLRDNMWLGLGLGTFYLYYPSVRLPGADDSAGNWAHMDPYQFGIEMGIIAPVLFYLIGFALLFRVIKAMKAMARDDSRKILIMGLFAALFTLILHTHATFHMYLMPILIIIGVWMAMLYDITKDENSYQILEFTFPQKVIMTMIALSFAGLIGAMAASSAYAQIHLIKAQEHLNSGRPEQFTKIIEKTEKWAPRSFIDSELQLASLYIDLLNPLQASALFDTETQAHLYEQSMILLDIADTMNPAWAEIPFKRGQLYMTKTDIDNAITAQEEAVNRDRTHFGARRELADLYMSRGRADDAFAVLKEGLAYPHPMAVQEDYIHMMHHIKPLSDIQADFKARTIKSHAEFHNEASEQ